MTEACIKTYNYALAAVFIPCLLVAVTVGSVLKRNNKHNNME